MRKFIAVLLFPFLLACAHQAPPVETAALLEDPPVAVEPPDKEVLCELSHRQAYLEDRYMVGEDQQISGTIPNVGQCVDGLCVVKERVGSCGQIVQLVSTNGQPVFIVILFPVYFVYSADEIDVAWEMVSVTPAQRSTDGAI